MSTGQKLRVTFRTVCVIAIAAFIVVGPGIRQIGGSKNVVFRNWVMYSGFGRKMCQVEYYTLSDEGQKQAVDRFALLGEKPWYSAPRSLRRIRSKADVERFGRRICSKLPEGSDLRVVSSCGSRSFWEPTHDGSEPLCKRQARPIHLPLIPQGVRGK